MPYDECAVAFFGEAYLGQFIVDALHLVAVKGFAKGDVDFDAYLSEEFVEGDFRDLHDLLPDSSIFRVAILQ